MCIEEQRCTGEVGWRNPDGKATIDACGIAN
jgi:hypothetical protein